MGNKARYYKTFAILFALFAVTICLNVSLWSNLRPVKIEWRNIPPTPGLSGALWSSLGDAQFAYRMYGIAIQNMGDTAGRITNLREYNYADLQKWFYLQHKLDPDSSHTPYLAGYFFGGVRDPEKLRYIVDYLVLAAGDGEGQKWRFLGQAAFLARFKMNDMDLALKLARKLSNFDNPDLATWARQMPVFILTAQGEKQAAYTMMVNLLKSDMDKLHPNEVNATLDYLCTRILNEREAMADPLCKDFLSKQNSR